MTVALTRIQTEGTAQELDLRAYTHIVLNTSGGKDSSVMAWHVTRLAEAQGVRERLAMAHATFPEEWGDAADVARQQAEQLSVPLHIVSRGEPLLAYVRRRGMWPASRQRYCTSEFKRAPIHKLVRHLAPGPGARILNVMGIRAQESPARAKKPLLARDPRQSNSKRIVDTWLPILTLSEAQVWRTIREQGLPVHRAYSLGFPRLSCRICIYASADTLLAAAWEHPHLFAEYLAVERAIKHRFRMDVSLEQVWERYQRGERPKGPLQFDKEL